MILMGATLSPARHFQIEGADYASLLGRRLIFFRAVVSKRMS